MSREDEIRERLKAASPGPWTATTTPMEHSGGWPVLEMGDHVVFCAPCHGSDGGTRESDVAFIAGAPEDIDYLIGEVECLRREIVVLDLLGGQHKRTRDALTKLADSCDVGAKSFAGPQHPAVDGATPAAFAKLARMLRRLAEGE